MCYKFLLFIDCLFLVISILKHKNKQQTKRNGPRTKKNIRDKDDEIVERELELLLRNASLRFFSLPLHSILDLIFNLPGEIFVVLVELILIVFS